MPKVLILVGSLTAGGAERVVVSLARYLVDAGDQVHVVTMHGTERDFYTLDSRVKRSALELGTPNSGFGKVWANLKRFVAIRKTIRESKAEVVIGFMTANAVLAITASLGLGVPVIASERNFPGSKKIPFAWAFLRKLMYRFADGHVAQTERAAQWLLQHTSAKNISVVPNSVVWPIPCTAPIISPEEMIPPDKRVLLAVGTKPYQKGFDLLVDVFSSIADEYPEWVLAIAGVPASDAAKNKEICQLLRQIEASKARDKIILPGRVGNISAWYDRASLFVLSSRYEGIPNALLEAMAAGKACIAFDCDTGPREIIEDNLNGLLVPDGDVRLLAAQIGRLLGSEDARSRLGQEARMVIDRFSEEVTLSGWKMAISVARNLRKS